MKNDKGIIEAAVLLYFVIAGIVLFFVPNPVSSAVGIGIKPNKTVQVQTQTVEPIKDAQGNPVAYKTTTNISDQEIQQHVGFFEWLRSLPILVLFLMGAGVIFPPVALFLHNLRLQAVSAYDDLTGETKRIVISIKAGLLTIQDPIVRQTFLDEMSKQQDVSTKNLVKELLKGN